jgi:hypothetical protein
MKLERVNFKEIKEESQYIVRNEDWEYDLEVYDGIGVVFHICQYFGIDEEDIEDYGGMENALDACEERMGDGWDRLEIYEVIS